jgi:rubrerythrin
MLFQSSCRNCHELEKEIIKLFTSKYIQKTYFGREYFEGDQHSMIGDLCDIVKNEGIIQDVIVEENDTSNDMRAFVSNIIVEETIQDVIVEETIQEIFVEETIQDVIVEETIQEIIVEETIQDVIVEETIQDVIVEETIQEIIVEEIIQDIIVEPEEIIQDIIVEENDTSNDMRAVQCVFVSNNIEEEEEEEEEGGEGEKEKEKLLNGKKHYCAPCGYPCNSRSNLTKHFKSKKHKDKIENPNAVIEGGFKCLKCAKIYRSNPGLWAHKKVCTAPEPIIPTVAEVAIETDLRTKIDNLERIMMEMAKNFVS